MTPLFWGSCGTIACAKHAPTRRSDTWNRDAWRAMTPSDRAEWRANEGSHRVYGTESVRLECEFCTPATYSSESCGAV